MPVKMAETVSMTFNKFILYIKPCKKKNYSFISETNKTSGKKILY